MKFQIKNRFTSAVQFECELSAEVAGKSYGFQLGFAVKEAIKSSADLRSADLSSADLRFANLSSADLSSANLRSANLSSADLRSADLRFANLSSADLRFANLRSANLRSADLRSADLRFANLRSADLRSANLRSADLRSANLSSADLSSANLSSADLRSAKNSELAVAMTRILPAGDLIGWKQCRDKVIVKLRIPESAKRSHAFGRKCRAEYADVIEVIGADIGVSHYDGAVKYTNGQRVTPHSFDDDWTQECSGGVHFFTTRLEAEAYSF